MDLCTVENMKITLLHRFYFMGVSTRKLVPVDTRCIISPPGPFSFCFVKLAIFRDYRLKKRIVQLNFRLLALTDWVVRYEVEQLRTRFSGQRGRALCDPDSS